MEIQKIKLPFKIKKSVLALGSQTKNTVCFVRDNFAYLSPLHLDLSQPKDFLNFEKSIRYFLKKKPKIIACDLHPEYQSTKFAQQLHTPYSTLYTIQHHHAHIASCMADNGLKNQKVIGVAFDGTGLGTDNKIWGGEFLVCDYKGFSRRAHLREIPLLGGAQAIIEPWRPAIFWLYLAYGDNLLKLKIDFVKGVNKNNWQTLKSMYVNQFNSPLVSSMGRLFDAAASLILAKYYVKSEAELAIELEKKVHSAEYRVQSYNFKIYKKKESYILDPQYIFKKIVRDLKEKELKEIIAYRFHLTVAEMIKKTCLVLRKETKINKVALSGGVFQNKLLLHLTLDLLYKKHFQIFTHRNLSCNDSPISLGQAVIAGFKEF